MNGLQFLLLAFVVAIGERVEHPVEIFVRRDCEETCQRQDCSDYRGCMNMTRNGMPCERWDTVEAWKGLVEEDAENYCRNPCANRNSRRPCPGIWCWTDKKRNRWNYCEPWVGLAVKREAEKVLKPVLMHNTYLYIRKVIAGSFRRVTDTVFFVFGLGLLGACFHGHAGVRSKRILCIAFCSACLLILLITGFLLVFAHQAVGIHVEKVPYRVNGTKMHYIYNPTSVGADLSYVLDIGVHSCGEELRVVPRHDYRMVFIARPAGNITIEPNATNRLTEPQVFGRLPSTFTFVKRLFAIRKLYKCLSKSSPKVLLVLKVQATVLEGQIRSPMGSFTFGANVLLHHPLALGAHKCDFAFNRAAAALLYCGGISSLPRHMAPLLGLKVAAAGIKRYNEELHASTIQRIDISGSAAMFLLKCLGVIGFTWLVVVLLLGYCLSVHVCVPLLKQRFERLGDAPEVRNSAVHVANSGDIELVEKVAS